ncbi:uncharacterized protein BO95DRAFT_461617 [Aspergillus brunneoviolaceus CBS 621.78]|uniref:Uncharacterized protein n=1 Tax=Aspergillus brunneoviolaceus CBS 621.78 TaxID=1450534 RepID=A0ACD1GF69_9EURO|nr:hypothetical protein BO95DRAFT_461617 [Aspergillus brunneoviolaceus CBS 621.78]RAH47867.1 hypothetical protein BO95DRAFT_461617 [Aspergillus brunneoviolaceus CBS 621.78]
MLRQAWNSVVEAITGPGSKVWEKLPRPTVGRGKTQWPKSASNLENHGVRFDYDGTIEENGSVYHKYQVQPNAGKIPSSWKGWRDRNRGTHAVIGTVKVKQDATRDDVDEALRSLGEQL